jgi:hypothetical protein
MTQTRRKPSSGRTLAPEELDSLVHVPITEVGILCDVASHHGLSEELALTLLKRRDLPKEVLESLAKNGRVMKRREIKTGLVKHQRTPRHISLPLIKHLYTTDMMLVALTPGVAADMKMAIEEALIKRMPSISTGERMMFAKRASGRVAAHLLNDEEPRILDAALNNPYLTESLIIKQLVMEQPSQLLTIHVAHHPKWSLRKDIRVTMLKNPYTPLAFAIVCAQGVSAKELKDLLFVSQLPEQIKEYLLLTTQRREERKKS